MLRARRKKIFLLIILFAAFSPILIIYSLGYTFDFAKGSWEKTGGIFLKSKIPRLSLFLNGKFEKETSFLSGGVLLTKIKPGNYLIRLEKKDYQPWSKTVYVEKGMVTELRNILPVPTKIIMATSTAEETEFLQKKIDLKKQNSLQTLSSEIKVSLEKNGDLLVKTDLPTKLTLQVHSFRILDDKIIFADKNGFLAWMEPQSKNVEIIGRPGFYLKDKPFQFLKSAQQEVLTIDSMGGAFLWDSQTNKIITIDGGLGTASFDEKGEKLLLVKKGSISILWRTDNILQPFQKKGIREEILQSSSIAIEEAKWFYGDSAHIIIKTRDGIFMTETDGRGGRNTIELFSGKTEKIETDSQTPNLLFIKRKGVWYKTELI